MRDEIIVIGGGIGGVYCALYIMNIRQLEIFQGIMKEGSLTKAAEKLFITQPSASKHLKLLEESLGFALFLRSGNKLLPTSEGKALYAQVEKFHLQ